MIRRVGLSGSARAVAIWLALVTLAASGCAVNGLQLTRDARVTIDYPGAQARVTLPLRLRWHVSGALPRPTTFAVFIDREPMPPGKDVHWLGDTSCKRTPGCPDATYLADRYIYVTRTNEVTLDALPVASGSGGRVEARGFHEATIVLLDARRRRFDEAAYSVTFSARNR